MEFEEKKKQLESFKKELSELKAKYGIGVFEDHSYGYGEEYLGSTQYFTINGQTWYGESVEEIINETLLKQE